MGYGYSVANDGTAPVGTTTAEVLAANADRKFLLLQNMSANLVSLRLGTADAVASEGIRLAAGGSYEMSLGLGNVYSGAIQGIAAADDSALSYIEGE